MGIYFKLIMRTFITVTALVAGTFAINLSAAPATKISSPAAADALTKVEKDVKNTAKEAAALKTIKGKGPVLKNDESKLVKDESKAAKAKKLLESL